jgi:hypothetical protein
MVEVIHLKQFKDSIRRAERLAFQQQRLLDFLLAFK